MFHRPISVLALLLLLLPLAGCVSIPNARELSPNPGKQIPPIEGASRPLSKAQDERAFQSLARYDGDDEVLQRQVALEGQIMGTPLVAGNKVTLLQNGRPAYDAMERAILAAKTNISAEFYEIDGDSIGTSITDMLIDKARQGVAVELIYDSYGSTDTPPPFWDRLRAAGVKVLEYNPLNPLKARIPYEPNDRDHRKLLIIDGKQAVLGGINITEIYLYGGAESGTTDRWWLPWRDTDVVVEGPVVAELQQFFLDVWKTQKGDPLPAVDFFPPLKTEGPSYVRATPGTPQEGEPQIYVALLSAIRHAQSRVWISTAFFDPTEEERQLLIDAARRGIDVQLIVPGESDSQATLAAGRSHYEELLKAGIKIYERRDVFLHGKTATIDGVWSIVGSSNFDARSVIWNNELSVIVLGRDFAQQMEAAFVQDRAAGTPIDLTTWENRPFGDRITDWAARAFEGLL